jgi:hypothetical protein
VVLRTFSPARAWRPAVGYRLARTLGLAWHQCGGSSSLLGPRLASLVASRDLRLPLPARPRYFRVSPPVESVVRGSSTLAPAKAASSGLLQPSRARGLTPRSSGASTACRQARAAAGFIICRSGLAPTRRRPLSSNVRPHTKPCGSDTRATSCNRRQRHANAGHIAPRKKIGQPKDTPSLKARQTQVQAPASPVPSGARTSTSAGHGGAPKR